MTLQLATLSKELSLKGPGTRYDQEKVSRENQSLNISD